MRETMAAPLSSQLDFILFFYGLAFILLGATCFALAKERDRVEPFSLLGVFGFIHGAGEWLDLSALIIGDAPVYAAVRCTVMTVSFIALMEFGRREAIRTGLISQGLWPRWFYLVQVSCVIIVGYAGGISAANALSRYIIGFLGALSVSAVMFARAKDFSSTTRRLVLLASVEFALYGIAAGLITPPAPFWPADTVNTDWFIHLTGIPIQLIRGLLACFIAFTILAIFTNLLIRKVASENYTTFLRRQFIWTLAAITMILVIGWILTESLGGIYKRNVQFEAEGEIDLLASHLAGETSLVEGMVKAMAGTPSIITRLAGAEGTDRARAQSALDRDVDASGAKLGFILDRSGHVVAASDHADLGPDRQNYSAAAFFRTSLAGEPASHFEFNSRTREQDYYAGYPIRDENSTIVGVAVLMRSLNQFGADLAKFNMPYFFINPDGLIVLTNQPNALFRPFWPLPADKQQALAAEFKIPNAQPMAKQQVIDATWIDVDGTQAFARRHFAHSSQWSLVLLVPTKQLFASRVLGIIITLLVTIMALIYLFGRERNIRDNVEAEKRMKLQDLARDLTFQATTDPLTGLANRLKFDQMLAHEMLRAGRYGTPLALVLYDIDHFKEINDSFGHQIGDKVLVQLSRYVAANVRSSDLISRWGGEEFFLLIPGSAALMAYQAAEKLRKGIEQMAFEGSGSLTCSFGVAEYAEGDTAESLIARADRALYRAKLNGRNRVEPAESSSGIEFGLAI